MRPHRLAALLVLLLAAPAAAQPEGPTVSELLVMPSPTVSEVVVSPCRYVGGVETVAVPGRPVVVAASADGCWLFADMSQRDGGGIGEGDLAVLHYEDGRFKLVGVTPLKGSYGDVVLSHDGKTLVAGGFNRVTFLDVAKLEAGDADPVTAILPLGAGAVGLAISRDDRLLFISQKTAGRLVVVDFAQARAGRKAGELHIDTGLIPVGLTFSSDGARLFSISEIANPRNAQPNCQAENGGPLQYPEGVLTVIDVRALGTDPSKAVLAVRHAGCNPINVALSPDGGTIWVTARGDGRLLGFAADKLVGASVTAPPEVSIKVGPAPIGLAVRADGQVWVADSNEFSHGRPGSLTALSPSGQVLRTLPGGVFPRNARFLPDGKTLVVTQFDSKALQFVPTEGP